jgi:hypothetical protein
MPAALGERLVLELDRGRSRPLEQPDRPLHVQRVAVAGVGVDDDGRLDAFAHMRERVRDFARRDKADVGSAQPRVGDRGPGEVKRLEAGRCGERGRQRVIDAGREDDAALRDTRFQRQELPRSVHFFRPGHIPR